MLDITASYMYNYKMRLIFLLSVKECLNFRASRGVSGALYLQSAIAGVMSCLGFIIVELPLESGVDVLVLRNGNP